MALLRPPAPDDATPDLAELGALWLRGLNASHDAGCGCGGLFVPALSGRLIEEDFLDYLHGRYEREKLAELAAFIDLRRRDDTRGVPPDTFERWIGALGDAPLPAADRARLARDIAVFVESMAGETRRGPGVCY